MSGLMKGKLKGDRLIVYLGGGRSTEWRDEFRERFGGEGHFGRQTLIDYDPFLHGRQGAIYEFTNDDLDAVSRSSLLIAHVDFERYTGLALEVGYARALDIPVMLIWTIGGRIDAMMAACALWVFTDYNEALNYLEDHLIPGKGV